MHILYTEDHSDYNPPIEIYDGRILEHGDRPIRVEAAKRMLRRKFHVITDELYDEVDLTEVHSSDYCSFLKSICSDEYYFSREFNRDKTDAKMTPYSRHSVEGAISAAKLAYNAAKQAYFHGTCMALTRPPGHHAGYDYSQGICFLNNGVFAVKGARELGLSAGILDFDLHYGGGTQELAEIYRIKCASLHESPDEIQSAFKEGGYESENDELIFNQTLRDGTGNTQYLERFKRALEFLKPVDLMVISAGFDISPHDRHSRLALDRGIFSELGKILSTINCYKAIILEGGYYTARILAEDIDAFLQPLSGINWECPLRVSIIYHSETGNTRAAAKVIEKGIKNILATEVRTMPVNGIDISYIKQSQVVIFGGPTYYGGLSWQLKKFLDTFEKWGVPLAGKLGACFATCNWLGGGGEAALNTMQNAMLCYGMSIYSSGIYHGSPYNHMGYLCRRTPSGLDIAKGIKFGRDVAIWARNIYSRQ